MVLDTVLYSPDKPHFCITTDEETPQKLVIPAEFLTEYVIGDLPSLVFLRVPGGTTWPVEVVSENKIVSFDKGWKEFAQHFSLQSGGRIVVFQYVSYETFSVFIFDQSVEIKYPCFTIIHEDEEEEEEPEIEIKREASIEILDEAPSHLRQYANPCSGFKRRITDPSTNETGEVTFTGRRGLNHEQDTEDSNRKASGENGRQVNSAAQEKMKAHSLEKMKASGGLRNRAASEAEKVRCDNSAAHGKWKARTLETMKASGSKERSENGKEFGVVFWGDKASCSCSAPKRPIAEASKQVHSSAYSTSTDFFMVPIMSSSVGTKLVVPADFARSHMMRRRIHVTLCVHGSSWIVIYRYYPNKKRSAWFSHGWHDFAVDNNLEVGDVCIFNLIDSSGFKFEVSILRGKSG